MGGDRRPVQLPLDVGLREGLTLEGFDAGANAEAVAQVRRLAAGGGSVYLWGPPGCGKSHLLQAACRAAADAGRRAMYLPLGALAGEPAEILQGVAALDLLALDDLQAVAGRRDWETGLFTLLDALRDAGGALVAAGRQAPGALGLAMPELVTRLGRGPVYRLAPLDDEGLRRALAQRARSRGILLSDPVLAYLLARHRRDGHALFRFLDRLDRRSLAEGRRVTLPFVRRLLAED